MALVLARKDDEKIVLHTSDGDITITLMGRDNNQTKLAIDAPKSVEIARQELGILRRNQG